MQITEAELLKCKRAVVLFTEFGKVVDNLVGTKQTVEAMKDIQTLIQVLRRLEPIAAKSKAKTP